MLTVAKPYGEGSWKTNIYGLKTVAKPYGEGSWKTNIYGLKAGCGNQQKSAPCTTSCCNWSYDQKRFSESADRLFGDAKSTSPLRAPLEGAFTLTTLRRLA